MNGRIENENKIRQRIFDKISKMPNYMTDYYYSLVAARKTNHTIDDYINKISLFLESHDYNLKNITRTSTLKYFISIQSKSDGKNTSDSYQRTVWYALDSFFNYMVLTEELKENYMATIPVPKDNDLDRINKSRILLTEYDFSKILKVIQSEPSRNKNRDYLIMLLLMTTGMRETALISINIEDINFEKQTLLVTDKGKREFIYTIQPEVMNILYEWLEQRKSKAKGNALFINPSGDRLSTQSVYDIVQKYTKIALDKPVSPHKIRSGFCSILYSDTHDIEYVRKAVGHRRLTTTQRYIITDNKEMENASKTIMSRIK